MARVRSRKPWLLAGGSYTDRYGMTHSQSSTYSTLEYMTDDPTGSPPYHEKPASHTYKRARPVYLTGSDSRHGITRTSFNRYRLPIFDGYGSLGIPTFTSWGVLKTEALARISPDKPIVDASLFIFELRELPRLIFQTGKILAGGGFRGSYASALSHARDVFVTVNRSVSTQGNAYLAAQFGWAPLLNDLSKLIGLADAMDKRKKTLETWGRNNRIEGNLQGTSNHYGTSRQSHWPPGSYTGIGYSPRYHSSSEAWFVAKFTDFNTDGWPDSSRLQQFRTALGGGVSLSTIWNALPWSWLIDYFLNVGTYLAAKQSGAFYDLKSLCIMQRGKCDSSISRMNIVYYNGQPPGLPTGRVESWERRVYLDSRPAIGIMPILGTRQQGILAALAASRSRYGR